MQLSLFSGLRTIKVKVSENAEALNCAETNISFISTLSGPATITKERIKQAEPTIRGNTRLQSTTSCVFASSICPHCIS